MDSKERFEICKGNGKDKKVCPYYIPNIRICSICKCFLPLKVVIKSQECPKKKW